MIVIVDPRYSKTFNIHHAAVPRSVAKFMLYDDVSESQKQKKVL